ncbi:MAG: hypothetical protein E7578_03560 [Ruminococcaceae bacterium]|nr:hypothetical protein [Oscillospiraceae bacterium]
MKKFKSILLAALIASQSILMSAVSSTGLDSYYVGTPKIDGETSRTVDYIYDGVTRTDYVLEGTSKYINHGGSQRFSTLEFDPKQDDLYFEVRGGTYISSQVKTSTAMNNYNTANAAEGKRAIAGTNGDLWLMVNNRIFTSGTNQNVTKGYIVPMGFAMYDGELVCTQDLSVTGSWSFGVAADGTPLIGFLSPNIKATNQSTGKVITIDGINRIPENNHLVMYTDKGYSSNHSMNDAYEVIIDCGYDYTVNAGETITGTVTAITEPGGTKYNCVANRIVLTARGTDHTALLEDYKIGDKVSIKIDITDGVGNTEKWYTVTNCVSGHFPHVMNGIPSEWPSGQAVNYPQTCVAIKKNGNVLILTSYGRQGSYSEGIWIMEMPQLLAEMDVEWAFMLDGGGSADMVCENASGGYELTGRTSDNKSTTLGGERSVVNNIIIAVGPSKSGTGTDSINLTQNTIKNIVRDQSNLKASSLQDGVLSLTTTNFSNPSFKFDLFGGTSADTYKYMVVEGSPTSNRGGTFTLGLYPSAGRSLDPVMSAGKQVSFDCDGTWQRKVVDLSSLTQWTGRMNYIRMDLFDDTGIGSIGEGIDLTGVKFFKTAAEAQAYASGSALYGDADGTGTITLSDVSLILKYIAKWNVSVNEMADYNKDGKVTLTDAALILRFIAA